MPSVQVRILQSGRTDAYGLPLVPGSVATVDRSLAVSLVYSGFASWMNPADGYDGQTNIGKPSESYTLFQSGIPFWLPPGDGGANGLSFTDSAGNFTLSAAIVTNFWNFLSEGGYCYLPAGAGGLTTGGLYWCKMTSDTAGTVYADTYSGSMNPVFVASPTALSGITTGRITQSTSAIEITRFIMPANSMGPNGTLFINVSRAGDASATNKVLLVYLNSSAVVGNAVTTAQVGESSFIVRNIGVSNKQINPRSSGIGGYGGTVPSSMYSSVDTTNDVQVSVVMQIAANTASQILNGCMLEVRYGV